MLSRQKMSSGHIELDDGDPVIVEGLLRYLYTLTYPAYIDDLNEPLSSVKRDELSSLKPHMHRRADGTIYGNMKWWLRHLQMLKIAKRYHLSNLVRLASLRVLSQLEERFYVVEGWEYLFAAVFERPGLDHDFRSLQIFALGRLLLMSKTLREEFAKRNWTTDSLVSGQVVVQTLKRGIQMST
jgi:hypothetical protein